ncbi:N/A [soil metagenome]|nr:BlaI/MecI/CopY family transcriptional regulator [Acidobacteriota bacterium]
MVRGLWSSRTRHAAGDPLGGALGGLERQVMEVMWGGEHLVVRDVQARLQRPFAYTTVMTTLDRLFKKGFATRVREGRAFRYAAARTREEIQSALAAGVLSGVLLGGGDAAMPILSNLVEAVSDEEGGAELLDHLEQLVREKRRLLQERKP